MTLDDCVAAVVRAVDKARLESIVLVAHSLGGEVATETAVCYTDRVAKLVFVGALIPPAGQSAASVKLFFANDMSDEQWAGVWREFVPETPLLWNARLSGYPENLSVTYIR